MARQRRHTSRRRRRGRFSGLYRFFAMFAVFAAVLAACVVFFRVNRVSVEGNVRYAEQEIINVSGIQVGDNLVTLPRKQIAEFISTELPYVESVSIRRRLPDGIVIVVEEQVAVATVDSILGRWLISSQGKILEQAGEQPVMEITGINAQSPHAGANVVVSDEQTAALEHILALLTALEEKNMIAGCRALDCTATASMTLAWDIYTIKLPRGGDYPYMLRLIEGALSNEKMPQGVPGIFDLTVEDGAVHFRREK